MAKVHSRGNCVSNCLDTSKQCLDGSAQLIRMGEITCHMLDTVERNPVYFDAIQKVMSSQKALFENCLSVATKAMKKLEPSRSLKVKSLRDQISQRVVALQYRFEAVNGGWNKATALPGLLESVRQKAEAWKKKQPLYVKEDRPLSKRDNEKLVEACQYPEFVRVLLNSQELQHHFFTWCLRDNNGVSQFVEYPSISNRIDTVNLAERIGKLGAHYFAIQKHKNEKLGPTAHQKVICLPFCTTHKVEYLSVLNESREVILNGDWKLSIKQIFELFYQKHKDATDLEFFGSTGITNWHVYEIGAWNPKTKSYDHPELSGPQWWLRLPIVEEISKKAVEERYGETLKEGEWLACVSATRKRADWQVEDRHGYIIAVVPVAEDRYRIFPMGDYPLKFPSTLRESFDFLGKFIKGKFAFVDYNYFTSTRQHAVHPIKQSHETLEKAMEVFRDRLSKSIKGQQTFQFKQENCAQEAQKTIHTAIAGEKRNYFAVELSKAHSKSSFLAGLLAIMRNLSPTNQQRMMKTVLSAFGGTSSFTVVHDDGTKTVKSVVESLDKEKGKLLFYHPSYLFQQISEGKLPGKIHYGN